MSNKDPETQRAYRRKWYGEHRGEIRTYQSTWSRNWRKQNPERARARDKKQYEASKEKRRESTRQWVARNKEHVREYGEKRRARLREHRVHRYRPENMRDWHLVRRYGMTAADYRQMLARQGGVCAVCGVPPKDRRLAVDHNHATGRVRGLLCFRCNTAVGLIESSGFGKVIEYVRLHGGVAWTLPLR